MSPLFRVFIPSWRFFDRVGPRPQLLVRTINRAADTSTWSPWVNALPDPPAKAGRTLFNPGGNLHHANQNLLTRLLGELDQVDPARVAELTSYRIARHLARAHVPPDLDYQFKVTANDADALISPEFGART